jgi:hypothetical protein
VKVKDQLDFGFSVPISLDDSWLGFSGDVKHWLEYFLRERRGNGDGVFDFADKMAFVGRE